MNAYHPNQDTIQTRVAEYIEETASHYLGISWRHQLDLGYDWTADIDFHASHYSAAGTADVIVRDGDGRQRFHGAYRYGYEPETDPAGSAA